MLGVLDYLAVVIATTAVLFAWRTWVLVDRIRADVADLRFKLRRELGSDGL